MRLEELVNKNYSNLSENDLYILKYILANKKKCCNLGIRDLASNCNVSTTTILRFTQKLGFKGYSEFKVLLNLEDKETDHSGEDKDCVASLYLDLEETIKNFKQRNVTEICKLLHEADRVFIYGTGTAQTAVAKEMHRVFLKASKYFHIIEGETELQIILPNITQNDIIIIVSLSGSAEYMGNIVRNFNLRNIKYISMTQFIDNKVARHTPYNLYISTTTVRNGTGLVYTSTMLFFVAVDVLFRQYLEYIGNESL